MILFFLKIVFCFCWSHGNGFRLWLLSGLISAWAKSSWTSRAICGFKHLQLCHLSVVIVLFDSLWWVQFIGFCVHLGVSVSSICQCGFRCILYAVLRPLDILDARILCICFLLDLSEVGIALFVAQHLETSFKFVLMALRTISSLGIIVCLL